MSIPDIHCILYYLIHIFFITYLWESTVVPDVTVVWETVSDESELTLLSILLDWVEVIFLTDLFFNNN